MARYVIKKSEKKGEKWCDNLKICSSELREGEKGRELFVSPVIFSEMHCKVQMQRIGILICSVFSRCSNG